MNFAEHIARLKAGVYATYSLDQIPKWIEEKTFLRGRLYSFRNHEFQKTVLSDTSQEVNCQKCSQIGMTESQGRWSLGICKVFPGFSLIYTMPYSNDASLLCRTRIDPIIQQSPELKNSVNPELNNSEVKQFGMSFMYFRGTQGNTQAISTPADAIVSDEIDRSSAAILDQYTSRLTHSAWKLRRNFSTPTVDGYGIALKMESSRRFHNLCKCNHCNEIFKPDYYEHVKIPGFDAKLDTIEKRMLGRINWKQARLLCPKCGKVPSLMPEHRMWVQENTLDHFDAAGYYVSPFDAPVLITPADLVKASTDYASKTEFINMSLGLTAQDSEETLTLADLKAALHVGELKDSGIYAMGVDMGLWCRIVIGRIDPSSQMFIIVHREKVLLGDLEIRVGQLAREFRCVMKVFDSQPYVDIIMRMQTRDSNLLAGVFVVSKKVELFGIKEQKEDPEEGKLPVKQVEINRNKAFDAMVGHMKKIGLVVQADENANADYEAEMLDMKRILKPNQLGDMGYVWEKSAQGNDHYMFATLYLYVACKLRGFAAGVYQWPALAGKFAVAEKAQ